MPRPHDTEFGVNPCGGGTTARSAPANDVGPVYHRCARAFADNSIAAAARAGILAPPAPRNVNSATRNDPRSFNRVCAAAALLWLLVVGAQVRILRPTLGDFPQFYMGGTIALNRAWDDLYPIPTNPDHNPGEPADSQMRPGYERLAAERGVGDSFRFIQLPHNAVLFAPFALLSIKQAHWAWFVVSALCVWGVALQAGAIHRRLAGHPSRVEGLLALMVAGSFLALADLAEGNMSSLVALCIGAAVLDLLRPDGSNRWRGATALIFGALTKYAAAVLVPLYVLLGRWRTLASAAVLAVAWTGITLAAGGGRSFGTFFGEIAPTLGRLFSQSGNQSIQGVLLRAMGGGAEVLPVGGAVALKAAGLVILAAILGACSRARQRGILREPHVLVPAAVCLVCWLLLFSPIYWAHYALYLCPFWGWMLTQARKHGLVTRVTATFALVVVAFPFGGVTTMRLPQPILALLCIGTTVTFLLAARGLFELTLPMPRGRNPKLGATQSGLPTPFCQLPDSRPKSPMSTAPS